MYRAAMVSAGRDDAFRYRGPYPVNRAAPKDDGFEARYGTNPRDPKSEPASYR
jgi:hypothetical protein